MHVKYYLPYRGPDVQISPWRTHPAVLSCPMPATRFDTKRCYPNTICRCGWNCTQESSPRDLTPCWTWYLLLLPVSLFSPMSLFCLCAFDVRISVFSLLQLINFNMSWFIRWLSIRDGRPKLRPFNLIE